MGVGERRLERQLAWEDGGRGARQLGKREYLAISPHQIPQPMWTEEGDVRPWWKRLGEARGQEACGLLGKDEVP